MSGSPNGGQGKDIVLQEKKCKMDNNLEVKPAIKSWKLGAPDKSKNPVSPFPYLITFINLACVAYIDHNGASLTESKNHENPKSRAGRIFDKCQKIFKRNNVFENKNVETKAIEEEDQEQTANELTKLGFVFLAEARNNSNGYRGVAYVHKNRRQVVLSHRGTKPSNLGAIWVDAKNIWWGDYTSHLSSAITFAYHVAQFAVHNNCQLFFTGHSLGAWLAQITCFSTKYLKLCTSTGHFVRKPQSEWDSIHPYTVAFDSPGALEFLQRMKKDLILRNDATSQMQVNVECLPVEVYQFYTNTVNSVNTQIGSVFLVNLEKAEVSYTYVRCGAMDKSVTFQTHGKKPVRNFLSNEDNESEEGVLESQVLDWRVENWDDFLHKWKNEGRSVKVELHKFAEYFLTRDELEVLKKQSEKVTGGCYEGLFSEDENVANRILEYCKRGGVFVEGSVHLGENLDRREVIPQVRQFAQALKNEVIWWNPTKPPVPENYIGRSVAETRHFRSDGSLDSSFPQKWLEELVEPLVLLVDPPGMGKSSEMSDLEKKLRMQFSSNRIILRINLNEVQPALKFISPNESVSSVVLKLAPFLPVNILQTGGVRLFVLLDGLDEVCPTHQHSMISLLRIFNSSNEPELNQSLRKNVRVVVTTRPHLREAVEKEFKLESWSLLPLEEEEQNEYMKSVLGVSDEQLSEIRGNLTPSVGDLLSNPLMLSMFVVVLQSGGFLSAGGGDELNIFDLYTRYVESKHELQVVEKWGMEVGANCTEMTKGSNLRRSIPFYYHVACNQLIDDRIKLPPAFTESLGRLAIEPPPAAKPGSVPNERDELLSVGLLIEGSEGRLVFKHRSFAEFFYARLLTVEESAPQVVRDVLFGNIYAGWNVLDNVEAFVVGVSRKLSLCGAALQIPLSPKWLLLREDLEKRCETLRKFVKSGKLFACLVKDVLLSFVHGDPNDLWEALRVLLHEKNNGDAFAALFGWMKENEGWTRRELLGLTEGRLMLTTPTARGTTEYHKQVTRLTTAIGLMDEASLFLSGEEVGVAINSVDRLVYIVASIQKEGGGRRGRSKWEWVEEHVSGGRSQLKKLFLESDDEDWSVIIEDRETAWKLASVLSQEEISALVTNEETRVSDVIGEKPQWVGVAVGEEFVLRRQLAEFRGKFGEDKGKTVFEMSEGGFAVEWLWGELVGEVLRGDSRGPVTVALRDALRRMGVDWCWLLRQLEWEVQRRRRSCRRCTEDEVSVEEEEMRVGGAEHALRLLEWVTKGLQWDSGLTYDFQGPLPFLLRYCGNVDPTHLVSFFQRNKHEVQLFDFELMPLLRSLVIASSLRLKDDSKLFDHLTSVLREILDNVNPEFRTLVGVFLGATREQIAEAAAPPPSLVEEVSVGGVALNLIAAQQQQQPTSVDKKTWEVIAGNVFHLTACCDLPAVLQELRRQVEDGEQSLEVLKEVLVSWNVLWGWQSTFSSWNRREEVTCGVRNILAFYFSVFGLNLTWMKTGTHEEELEGDGWPLWRRFPVEVASALRYAPQWAHLLPQFQEILTEHLREKKIVSVGGVAGEFRYQTEGDWMALLPLINAETLLPSVETEIVFSVVAAPLFRALIQLYGVEWTKSRLTHKLWNRIPSTAEYSSSVGSLGSLLHSAIELDELEEVKKRAWPGFMKWRNGEGKTALQLARETYDKPHPIRVHLEQLTRSIHPR